MWANFRTDLNGATPTQWQVLKKAMEIDDAIKGKIHFID
jgi:hypothetical protein